MPALCNYTYGNINFYPGGFGGMGAASAKRKAHERSDLFLTFLSLWLWLGLRSDCQVWNILKKRREIKKIVTQGGTRTHNMANGLPCSNQLSYWVTRQLSGWVQVLKAELPEIQLNLIPSWHVWWGGCGKEDERWSFYARLLYASLVSTAQMEMNFYLGSFGGGGGDSRHVLMAKEVSLADRRFPYIHLGQPEMICLCERG